MIYLTSSESADPHHLGQIRGVGRQAPSRAKRLTPRQPEEPQASQVHHHGSVQEQSSIMPIGTRYEPMEYRIGNGSQLDSDAAAAEK